MGEIQWKNEGFFFYRLRALINQVHGLFLRSQTFSDVIYCKETHGAMSFSSSSKVVILLNTFEKALGKKRAVRYVTYPYLQG